MAWKGRVFQHESGGRSRHVCAFSGVGKVTQKDEVERRWCSSVITFVGSLISKRWSAVTYSSRTADKIAVPEADHLWSLVVTCEQLMRLGSLLCTIS